MPKVTLKKEWENPAGRIIEAGEEIIVTRKLAKQLVRDGIGDAEMNVHDTADELYYRNEASRDEEE